MLRKLQPEIAAWRVKNFPESGMIHQFMGMVEEVGELSHAILKDQQGVRDSNEDEAKDAVGDILIFLINFCSTMGWDVEEILTTTWDEVKQRDWIKHPVDGRNE